MRNCKPILLAEDDNADSMMTQRALNDLEVTNKLIHKVDGEDALEYLRDPSKEKPSVILLDLNMPRMDGFEFMEIIKVNEDLKSIPVVVLSTSDMEEDINRSFKLGACGYIVKPVDYKRFVEVMKTVDMYWTLSRLPDVELQLSLSR
jgi:CheY-like chemotaxis protein